MKTVFPKLLIWIGPLLIVVGTVGFGTEKMFSLLFLAFAGAIALSVGITLLVRK